jgi:HEAT repeat protein
MNFFLASCLGLLSLSALAAVPKNNEIQLLKKPLANKHNVQKEDLYSLDKLQKMFAADASSPEFVSLLKRHTLRHRQKAVPLLINVMKSSKFPDQNRWHATMLLGRIMGKNSAPFIAKFSDHPLWMMRVASLKALLALKQDNYVKIYAKALQDPSLIVRVQALDNISQMKIKALAPHVWQMMYDGSNYSGDIGNRKRTSIVKTVIRTLGDLRYEEARSPLLKLIQKSEYADLQDDLDYSLEKITGLTSPDQNRKGFWAKHSVAKQAKKI